MTHSTDHLISGLVEDLGPVRPVWPMRIAVVAVLGVAALVAVCVLVPQSAPIGVKRVFQDEVYLVTCLGFFVLAVSGTIGSIASGRPGSERLENRGQILGFIGLGVAAAACGMSMINLGLTLSSSPAGLDGMCLRSALKISVLPALVVGGFVARGWTHSPFRAGLAAFVSAGAIGGGVIHMSCGNLQPQHLLLGHLAAPVLAGLVGFIPLGVWLRRSHA